MRKSKNTFIVLDVETTGLDFTKEKIIEFAAVKLKNGKIVEEFETLINPEQEIRYSSYKIHGITKEMVENQPTMKEVLPKILEFIGDYPIVGHNVIFDYNFLNRASEEILGVQVKNPRLDSQQMYKEVFPEEPSHGLEALMTRLNVEFDTRHRAMADTVGLAKAFPKLKKLYDQKFSWQLAQIDKVPYLFERYIRIQNAIQVMQSELADLKSVFKVYFENSGEDVIASTGETLTYSSKIGYIYDFDIIKEAIEELENSAKIVKLNNGLLDRMINSHNVDESIKEKLREGRVKLAETHSITIHKAIKNEECETTS